MLDSGTKLQERYVIERHVGQGGMGSVYLATDERFHSTVAIKEARFTDDTYRKAFEREARLLNSLKHSALPKVTDHFVEDNGQYIVMEFIGGDDLFEKMRKAGRAFPVDDVLQWSSQLLDALSYLHQQGIVHRDIKPQNLKLTPQGNIILLDFGLAKGNPTDANYQTAAQSIFGYSRNYASLEQIQGTGTDPRSDFYSFAATIYHLMTERVPADALTRVMKVLNENNDPLEPAGLFNSDITQEVSDALDSCLELKADSRPQNVEEMRLLLFRETKTKFTPPAARETAAGAGEDLLTQQTRLIEETGNGPGIGHPEARTEVMSGSEVDSARTLMANADTNVNPEPANTVGGINRWNWGIAAAGGIILAIVGAVSATVWLWPTANQGTPAASEVIKEDSTKKIPPSPEEEIQGTFELSGTGQSEAGTNPRSDVTGGTAAAKGRKDSPKTPPAKEKPSVVKSDKLASPGKIEISDSRVEADGVIVTPEKVEIRPKPPTQRRFPADIPIPREQFEKLTPRQKQRLIQALERQRSLRNRRLPEVRQEPTSPPPPPG